MAEPLPPHPQPEMPTPINLVVGETVVYLKSPVRMGGTDVTSIVIQPAEKRGAAGANSSVLLVKEPSRKKGEEGTIIDKPVTNVDPMDEMSWDKISGIQWTDETGVIHSIAKEDLALSDPKESPVVLPTNTTEALSTEPVMTEPQAEQTTNLSNQSEPIKQVPAHAREILSTLTEDPNTITIVGLRAYETRALDLADRAMQKLSSPKMTERADATKNVLTKTKDVIGAVEHFFNDVLWKQSVGGIYFHERAREYYLDMLKASETPFAEEAIRLAEARATERYNKKLADSNFVSRIGTKAVEWLKDSLGLRTAIQKMALEEIGVMKAGGEIKGLETFERESKAIRARFSQDMDTADQFVRSQMGEKLEILDATKEEHKPLVEGIQNLLKQYANGEITDKAEFDKRAQEFFNATLKNVRPDIFAEAELYSSSLFDAAEMLRTKMSHEAGLANLDEAMAGLQIRLGLGAMGEVTSLEPTAVERGIGRVREVYEWLNKHNVIVPMVFNEATVGSGVAIALSAVNFVKLAPIKAYAAIAGPLASLGGGALAGGLFAGWREYGQLQKDYLTHLRERESGTQFTDTQKRRSWFERLSVKQRSANEMMSTIQTAMDTKDYRTAMATIADLQARKAVSETGPKRIGLVKYSSREVIESERTALDLVANNALGDLSAIPDLGDVTGGNSFPDFMEKLTISQTQVLKKGVDVMATFDDPIKSTLGIVSEYAPEADIIKRRWKFADRDTTADEKALGMDAILTEFKKESRLEAIKYGVRAGVIGAGVGVAIHGIEALAHSIGHLNLTHTTSQTGGTAGTPSPLTPSGNAPNVPTPLPGHPTPDHPFTPGPESPPAPESPTVGSENFSVPSKEISSDGGIWDYFLGKFHGENTVSSANGMKNLFRLYAYDHKDVIDIPPGSPHANWFDGDAHHRVATFGDMGKVQEIDISKIPNDATLNLPKNIFGQNGVEWFQTNNDTAITTLHEAVKAGHMSIMGDNGKMTDVVIRGPGDAINFLYQSKDETQHLEGIILKLGYSGQDSQLPTNPDDLKLLYEHMGATVSTGTPDASILSDIHGAPLGDGLKDSGNIIGALKSTPPAAGLGTPGPTESLASRIGAAGARITDTIASGISHNYIEAAQNALQHVELPWFPVFIPYREALELAPTMETTASESVTPNESYMSPFGSEQTYLEKESIMAGLSPRLKEKPDAKLNQQEEIAWYLSQLPESEKVTLSELATQVNTPISPDVRAVIMIPATESMNMTYDKLMRYANQTNADGTPIDPKHVEFMVYDINPGRIIPEGQTEPLPSSVQTDVDRFVNEHPDMQVTYLTHTYTDPATTRGLIKRDMTNVVLARIGTLPQDHPGVSLVSDTETTQPLASTYLSGIINTMDSQPNVDITTGKISHPQEAYASYPTLFAHYRAIELFDALARHGEAGNVPQTYSGNIAIRAGTLAAVGGYRKETPIADDRELSWVVHTARGSADYVTQIPDMTIALDPKETTYGYLQQLGLADKNLPLETNDTYKDMAWTDMAQRANDAVTKEQLEAFLSHSYNHLYPSLKASNPTRFDGYFKRTMEALGVQYEIKDGNIVITDMSALPANMGADIDVEAFAKQASGEIIAQTATAEHPQEVPVEPATAREALETIRGPEPETPDVEAESNSKPLESNISSPDLGVTPQQTTETAPSEESILNDTVSTVRINKEPESPTTETIPATVEVPTTPSAEAATTQEALPQGVEERVKYILDKTKEPTAVMDVTSGEMIDYLKSSLHMAGGTRITEGNIQINGDSATLNDMVAKSFLGEARFNGKLIADPVRGLIIDQSSLKIDLPLLMQPFTGRIKSQLGNFNQSVLDHLGEKVGPEWKAERLDIVGDKLEVKFSRQTK